MWLFTHHLRKVPHPSVAVGSVAVINFCTKCNLWGQARVGGVGAYLVYIFRAEVQGGSLQAGTTTYVVLRLASAHSLLLS